MTYKIKTKIQNIVWQNNSGKTNKTTFIKFADTLIDPATNQQVSIDLLTEEQIAAIMRVQAQQYINLLQSKFGDTVTSFDVEVKKTIVS